MSETLPATAEPTTTERLTARGAAVLAAAAWPASLAVILARAAHALKLAENTFAVLAVWLISLACLGLGIAVFRSSDMRAAHALALLDFGNPALDGVLEVRRPHWRARRGVCTVFTVTASCGWFAAILYSVQIALGVYRLGPLTELFILGWFLGVALWSTVIVVTAPAEIRRAQALRLACEAHRAQRETRESNARRAADVILDAGEIPRPLALVDNDETAGPRGPGARFGAV